MRCEIFYDTNKTTANKKGTYIHSVAIATEWMYANEKMGKAKKTKNKKLVKVAVSQRYENYLIDQLKEEWEKIERQAKREEVVRKTKEVGIKMGKTILLLALMGGIVTVGIVAPNMFGAIGRIGARHGFFRRREFLKTKDYLRKRGYIKLLPTEHEGEYVLRLTDKGKERVLADQMKRGMMRQDVKQWDGNWRLVFFDVPEKHKSEREALRRRLREMGLYQLQDSVLVSPFPVQAEIEMFCEMLSITSYVRCIESKNIGDDDEVRDFFRLSQRAANEK